MKTNAPISISLHEAVEVETTRKSQDVERQKGEAMVRLIDSLSGPKQLPPPEGSTISVKA